MAFLAEFWTEQQGQDLIEYSLLLAFLAITCLAFIWGGQSAIDRIWHVNTNNIRAANNIATGV